MVFALLLAVSVASAEGPEAGVAELYGEPEIYSFSFSQYVGQGMNNFEMKMLMSLFVDSLNSALDSLYLELRGLYADCPEFLEHLDASHEAFLVYSDEWARLCEERVWWNPEEGTRSDGTARSYNYVGAIASWRWQKIVAYTRILRHGGDWNEAPDVGLLGLQDIGGYYP